MRPEILFPLFSPVSTLKGVGPKNEPLVQKLAGPLVRDMLFLGPQSLVHRTPTTVDSVVDGQVHTLIVDIEQHTRPPRMDVPYKIRAFDGTAFLTLIWFRGHGEHLLRSHPVGSRRVVSGKIERWGNEIQMAHPDYVVAVEKAADVPEVEAVYPATAGLPARTVRKLAHEALNLEDKVGTMLPCNVILQQVGDGRIEVSAVDPIASMQGVGNPDLASIAGEVRDLLKQVVEGL